MSSAFAFAFCIASTATPICNTRSRSHRVQPTGFRNICRNFSVRRSVPLFIGRITGCSSFRHQTPLRSAALRHLLKTIHHPNPTRVYSSISRVATKFAPPQNKEAMTISPRCTGGTSSTPSSKSIALRHPIYDGEVWLTGHEGISRFGREQMMSRRVGCIIFTPVRTLADSVTCSGTVLLIDGGVAPRTNNADVFLHSDSQSLHRTIAHG